MDSFHKALAITLLLGALLLFQAIYSPLDFGFALTIYAVAAFLLFSTFALKLFVGAETYYFIAMLRTQRFIKVIEKISKWNAWNRLADIGLVMGFGAIAVDYLIGRKFQLWKRLALDIAAAILLSAAFYLLFGLMFFSADPEFTIALIGLSISFGLGGLMLFSIAALVWQAFDIITKMLVGKTPCPGIAPIIPGVQIPNVPAAFTPPIYIWIAFVAILVVHEFSHGALVKRAGAKIKSVGLLLAGVFPVGAFVEPDEQEIKTKTERQQMRIYAIGPAANIYSIPIAIILMLVFAVGASALTAQYFDEIERNAMLESVTISNVLQDYDLCGNTIESPAFGEIEEGWRLVQFQGIKLESLADFKKAFADTNKNVILVLETPEGQAVEKNIERNKQGRIGIQMNLKYVEGKKPPELYSWLLLAISTVLTFFGWLILISFAIAMVNFLPTEPFDGGKIAKMILLPYFGFLRMPKQDTEKFIGRLSMWIVLGLILLNALPLLL